VQQSHLTALLTAVAKIQKQSEETLSVVDCCKQMVVAGEDVTAVALIS